MLVKKIYTTFTILLMLFNISPEVFNLTLASELQNDLATTSPDDPHILKLVQIKLWNNYLEKLIQNKAESLKVFTPDASPKAST